MGFSVVEDAPVVKDLPAVEPGAEAFGRRSHVRNDLDRARARVRVRVGVRFKVGVRVGAGARVRVRARDVLTSPSSSFSVPSSDGEHAPPLTWHNTCASTHDTVAFPTLLRYGLLFSSTTYAPPGTAARQMSPLKGSCHR